MREKTDPRIRPTGGNAQSATDPLAMFVPSTSYEAETAASQGGIRYKAGTKPSRLRNHVKRRAVRHSGAVLTYAPTYRPKEVSAQGILTSVSNFGGARLRRFLHSSQHGQPTTFPRSQLLSVQSTEFQSNQPAIFLAAEFDGSLCERALYASTRLCKHASACLPKFAGYYLCALLSLHTCLE